MDSRKTDFPVQARGITSAYLAICKCTLAYLVRSIFLLPLATASALTVALEGVLRYADRLEGCACRNGDGAEEKDNELLIPSPVLYEAYRLLARHGSNSREWVVALGSQEIDGKNVVTHVYDLKCSVSHSTGAEPDYSSLADALRFYENCGAMIAALAHIHPWHGRSVSPSAIDIETQRRWEELYGGRFIGIVFNNSGIFRIFHGGKSVLNPVITGEGVRRIGRYLYELERKDLL